MKFILVAVVVLALLCAMNVQAAGPPLGLLMIVAPILAFVAGTRRAGRWMFGFHRTMKKDGLW